MNESKKKKFVMTEEQFDDFSNKMVQQSIDGINEAVAREWARTLSEFSTEALEVELLRRKKIEGQCRFNNCPYHKKQLKS